MFGTKKRIIFIIMFIFIVTTMVLPTLGAYASEKFLPLPFENTTTGRNNNAYNPAIGRPTQADREAFVEEIKNYATAANKQWQVPTSAIIGIAVKESGYGFTRVAVNANNIYSMKMYSVNPKGAWQLKGQPYEGDGNPSLATITSANYGSDRLIFKEWLREDNWYRAFNNRQEAVNYFAGTLMQNSRYRPALETYQKNIANGWSNKKASDQYVYDIAASGYCGLGPVYFRSEVSKFMDLWDLYQFDEPQKAASLTLEANNQNPWISPINITPIVDTNIVSDAALLSVTAGADTAIAKVEFYSSNGEYLISTDTTAPYTCNWVTNPYVANGEQVLRAIVYDTNGQKAGTSRTITINN